jgi:hypothetical protein
MHQVATGATLGFSGTLSVPAGDTEGIAYLILLLDNTAYSVLSQACTTQLSTAVYTGTNCVANTLPNAAFNAGTYAQLYPSTVTSGAFSLSGLATVSGTVRLLGL